MRRSIVLVIAFVATVAAVAGMKGTVLPTLWRLSPPSSAVATTETMPQGIALSPNGKMLAVIESGVNPAALRILSVPALQTMKEVPLKDAFGKPVWANDDDVIVAGGAANAIYAVDASTGTVATLFEGGGYPSAVAVSGSALAVTSDESGGTAEATITRDGMTHAVTQRLTIDTKAPNAHPADIVRTPRGLYVARKGMSEVAFQPHGGSADAIPVDLHPAALALSNDGTKLYVACADADTVDVVDTNDNRVVQRIDVGLRQGPGASPNALAVAPDGTVYATLGAENAVAEIRNGRVVARYPTGWYPTGVAVDSTTLYVADGKGESSHANPQFNPFDRHGTGYVGSLLVGSVRAIPRAAFGAASTRDVLANIPAPVATPAQTVIRPNGPIRHVIYVIKENRTYDQLFGDIKGANGDPSLVEFGENNTPNDHAIVRRFGIFDNTYTDAQVSANGHNWSTAAFANDYLERFWPPNYGDRRQVYDFEDGAVASVPRNGYIWDDANAHHVSFRDYGEFVSYAVIGGGFVTTSMPGLKGHIDEKFPPFDLTVSDLDRVKEWKREFDGYVRDGNLPSLEIVRLPNDHTSGTKPGLPTPQAFVAQNDLALGQLVDIVSHSPYWKSTAIFVIEDDSQNGPDHVDDQRTTFYVASPYATPGVHHAHYTTSSVVRTIELLLGLAPMSIYDAVAPPLYDAFANRPVNANPYVAVGERIDLRARNEKTAYGAAASARMDWSDADRADERVLNDILAHVTGTHAER